MLQTGYIPDGWLGILVGAKLYFDLSKPDIFDRELDRLVIEIGVRGKLVPVEDEIVAVKSLLSSAHQGNTSTSEGNIENLRMRV